MFLLELNYFLRNLQDSKLAEVVKILEETEVQLRGKQKYKCLVLTYKCLVYLCYQTKSDNDMSPKNK